MKHLALLFPLLLLLTPLDAQERKAYVFRHLMPENGLLSSNIASLMQDRQGYIWIGQDGGLQRYDSENFLSFRHVTGDTSGLTPTFFKGLYEDTRGEIWCFGHQEIVIVLDPRSRTFRRIHTEQGFLRGCYFFESLGRFYVISDRGIVRLNEARAGIEAVVVSPEIAHLYWAAAQDSAGRLWSWGRKGFYCFDPASGQVFTEKNNPYGWKLFSANKTGGLRAAYFDRRGNLWFSFWGSWEIYRFNLRNNAFWKRSMWETGFSVSQFAEDANGRVWVFSSEKPPCYFLPEQETFICLDETAANDYYGFWGDAGYASAIRDREGNIWVGTDKGVNIFNPSRQTAVTFPFNAEKPGQRHWLRDIFQGNNGTIYLAYWRQLTALDEGFRRQYVFPPKNAPSLFASLDTMIFTVAEDTFGRIWTGQTQGWATVFSPSNRRIQKIRCAPCQGAALRNIVPARNGDLLIALDGVPGIARWHWRDERFEFFEIPAMKTRPDINMTRAILEDSRGNIWVGTRKKGLYRLDTSLQNVTGVYLFEAPPESYDLHNNIFAIVEISLDSFLVGTEFGLKLLDLKNNSYQEHKFSYQLPSGEVGGIQQDRQGNCWIVTRNGLYCISRDFSRLTVFTGTAEGILDHGFSVGTFFKLRDGRMMAGTYHGSYVVFHPDSLLARPRPLYAPVVTDLEVSGRVVPPDSFLLHSVPLVLPHDQNTLSIAYAALAYSNSDIFYEYKMEGLEASWNDAGKRRQVTYSNLPPGQYKFRVRAYTTDGRAMESTPLSLTIRPPWYQTWWFYTLLVTGLFAIGYAVFRDRIRRFRERASYEKRLSDLQNQALRAQINPHFIFNALQSVKKFVLENDVEQAEHYMSRFAQLMRQIMDNSREAAVSLRRELDLLDNYLQLEQLRFGHAFDYRFELASDLSPEEVEVPSMMLQPFAENAVLHGLAHLRERCGLLLVRCARRGGGLFIEIEDNGVGRARAEQLKNPLRRQLHRSAGMDITARRLALFSENATKPARFAISDLHDAAGNSAGTRVEIWLPVD